MRVEDDLKMYAQQHGRIYLRDALGQQSLSQMFQMGHLRD